MDRSTERAEQLREGIVGAAAALPEGARHLGTRTVEATDRILQGEAGAAAPAEAVEPLERAHYAMLRMAVLGEPSDEADLDRAVAELEAVAGVREATGDR